MHIHNTVLVVALLSAATPAFASEQTTPRAQAKQTRAYVRMLNRGPTARRLLGDTASSKDRENLALIGGHVRDTAKTRRTSKHSQYVVVHHAGQASIVVSSKDKLTREPAKLDRNPLSVWRVGLPDVAGLSKAALSEKLQKIADKVRDKQTVPLGGMKEVLP